jgi:serine phosphatase RsbU (regulator of sigma subunit)
VAVGDVAGHNTAAAAAMGQLRDALRAYALEGHPPATVMRLANQLIRNSGLDTIATCFYLELDITGGHGTAVLAGHPPPILRDGDQVDLLPLAPQPPLGAVANPGYADRTFTFPDGATLLLYTDGLVEDHQHPVDLGLHQLCAALRAAPTTDPAGVLDHILASEVGPRPRYDDIAVLCLIRTGRPGARR